jgi:hypothetical protein
MSISVRLSQYHPISHAKPREIDNKTDAWHQRSVWNEPCRRYVQPNPNNLSESKHTDTAAAGTSKTTPTARFGHGADRYITHSQTACEAGRPCWSLIVPYRVSTTTKPSPKSASSTTTISITTTTCSRSLGMASRRHRWRKTLRGWQRICVARILSLRYTR